MKSRLHNKVSQIVNYAYTEVKMTANYLMVEPGAALELITTVVPYLKPDEAHMQQGQAASALVSNVANCFVAPSTAATMANVAQVIGATTNLLNPVLNVANSVSNNEQFQLIRSLLTDTQDDTSGNELVLANLSLESVTLSASASIYDTLSTPGKLMQVIPQAIPNLTPNERYAAKGKQAGELATQIADYFVEPSTAAIIGNVVQTIASTTTVLDPVLDKVDAVKNNEAVVEITNIVKNKGLSAQGIQESAPHVLAIANKAVTWVKDSKIANEESFKTKDLRQSASLNATNVRRLKNNKKSSGSEAICRDS